jgi:hypothetical protein
MLASSAAADVKAYHGAFCIPSVGEFDEPIYSGDGILNFDSTDLSITCPLIRDQMNNANTLVDVQIEVHNDAGAITCTLESQDEDSAGTVLDFDTVGTSSIGDRQLSGFVVVASAGSEGSYSLGCSLGPDDILYHYRLEENDKG